MLNDFDAVLGELLRCVEPWLLQSTPYCEIKPVDVSSSTFSPENFCGWFFAYVPSFSRQLTQIPTASTATASSAQLVAVLVPFKMGLGVRAVFKALVLLSAAIAWASLRCVQHGSSGRY